MIDKISNYAESIVVLIIAITIVELILPNNKNKKYIMFVSGIIVMLGVVNPIIKIFDSDFDISKEVDKVHSEFNKVENDSYTNYDLNYNIYNTYIKKIEEDMVQRMEDMGYKVIETKININDKTYEPNNIEMKIKYQDGYVQPIVIDVFGKSNSEKIYDADINKIKEVLALNYGVDKNNIKINE